MKKHFLIAACVLTVIGIGLAVYGAGHPELALPWGARVTRILWGLMADTAVILFALAFWDQTTLLRVLTLLLILGAVFCLVQSILLTVPDGQTNWYLPLSQGLNCAALCLNMVSRRKQIRPRT